MFFFFFFLNGQWMSFVLLLGQSRFALDNGTCVHVYRPEISEMSYILKAI